MCVLCSPAPSHQNSRAIRKPSGMPMGTSLITFRLRRCHLFRHSKDTKDVCDLAAGVAESYHCWSALRFSMLVSHFRMRLLGHVAYSTEPLSLKPRACTRAPRSPIRWTPMCGHLRRKEPDDNLLGDFILFPPQFSRDPQIFSCREPLCKPLRPSGKKNLLTRSLQLRRENKSNC